MVKPFFKELLENIRHKKTGLNPAVFLAEEEGFEPPEPRSSTVFKTAAFDHSAIPPSAKVERFFFPPTKKNKVFWRHRSWLAFVLEIQE